MGIRTGVIFTLLNILPIPPTPQATIPRPIYFFVDGYGVFEIFDTSQLGLQ